MNATEAVAAMRRLIQAGAAVSLNRREIVRSMKQGDRISQSFAYAAEADLDWLALQEDAARPALSALAGMCVLPAEVVRLLLGLCKNHYDTSTLPAWHQDQFAAAEAELRRVEP